MPSPTVGPRPFDAERVAQLRTWSLRMRMAGELQLGLRQLLLGAGDDAGLVGPTGDALRALGQRLADDAAEAAAAAFDAADQLDRNAVADTLGVTGGGRA
jgi:hypothetical protein